MTLNTNILLTTLIKIIKTSTGILITIFISRFFGNDILGKFLFGDKLIIVITAISSLFSRNFLIKKSSLISNDIKSIAINYIMYNFLLFIIIFLVKQIYLLYIQNLFLQNQKIISDCQFGNEYN